MIGCCHDVNIHPPGIFSSRDLSDTKTHSMLGSSEVSSIFGDMADPWNGNSGRERNGSGVELSTVDIGNGIRFGIGVLRDSSTVASKGIAVRKTGCPEQSAPTDPFGVWT
jgi:hypothetical protein